MIRKMNRTCLLFLLVSMLTKLDEVRTFDPFKFKEDSPTESDQCFCQLEGKIDDCMCNVDTVDYFNNMKIFPRLQSLLQKDFFRYFKYNANRPCPFWNSSTDRCKNPSCGVKPCSIDEIPPGLINDNNENCQQKNEDSADFKVDSTISDKVLADLESWKDFDDSQGSFCQIDPDDNCPNCDYVDLSKNPERYTGYKDEPAHRVWRAIYQENCFEPPKISNAKTTTKKKAAFSAAFFPKSLEKMCLEKRAFYRAISGLHSSITVHLTAEHPKGTADSKTNHLFPGVGNQEVYGPNLSLFLQRFNPDETNGLGPYWLKNLYFVYLLELRAITKAAPYLESHQFYTGNDEEDKETQIAVKEILNLMKSFPDQFDETSMFTSGQKLEMLTLKNEFRAHFHNISRVMDCVGCEKCKLWGKLQITGLGTALKILFSGDTQNNNSVSAFNQVFINSSDALIDPSLSNLRLSRNEIVALLNAFGKLSKSIQQLEVFRRMLSIKTN